MCGIAGSFHPETDEEDPWVEGALDRIAHRGPDGRGVLTWTAATHGHVRLAIMDPLPRSGQPFIYGGVLLSYVGECWNYRELREWLENVEPGGGYTFQTDGDTEVVAALLNHFIARGQIGRAVTLMDGQFALAVTESVSGRTWLARDRLGEVPLYVLETEAASLFDESTGILWASERKAFDPERAASARPVPAGSVWQLGGGIPEVYYDLPSRVVDERVTAEECLALVRTAVRRRLMADVPVAFLASGGLDSSMILRLVQEEGVPVVAYVASLYGVESPDLLAAREVCAALGVELREVPVSVGAGDVRDAIRAIETPMKAQVEIATLCLPLAERIYADGFRVLLSGEGADELFGGYGNLMRKATGDLEWHRARRASVEKMARGNCVRTNKSFMAFGVEARLPFLDRDLVDAVLPLGLRGCPPGKGLLKAAGYALGLPAWVIEQKKRTFQGAAGVVDVADGLFGGAQIVGYNSIARELFGGLPRG